MSSLPLPPTDVPPILYCSLPDAYKGDEGGLVRSESLAAALTRLTQPNGTIRTVNHDDHLARPDDYVVRLDCRWPDKKAKTILDTKRGTISLREDGYDVVIRTQTRGKFSYVIINPLDVVYRVSLCRPSSSSVTIAQTSDTDDARHRARAKSDPRRPQEEVDALLLKLDPSRNPIDHFSVDKVAASHGKDVSWAKDQIVSILVRCQSRPDRNACWHFILSEGESYDEISLQVLLLSFGRTFSETRKGLKASHYPLGMRQDEKTETCVRPSHLRITSAIDASVLKRAVDSLSGMLGEFRLSK